MDFIEFETALAVVGLVFGLVTVLLSSLTFIEAGKGKPK